MKNENLCKTCVDRMVCHLMGDNVTQCNYYERDEDNMSEQLCEYEQLMETEEDNKRFYPELWK